VEKSYTGIVQFFVSHVMFNRFTRFTSLYTLNNGVVCPYTLSLSLSLP